MLVLLGLAAFYVVAANQHASTVNTSKARADQSGYLFDAEVLYHNWHGDAPPRLLHRNRMPLYGSFLALFYDTRLSDDDFFVLGRKLNIWLSIALLAGLAVLFARFLPPIAWMNLTVFVAFGYFIFRAGYTQSELLFYALFFAGFVACCAMFTRRRPLSTLGLAASCGALLGLAHLAKAATLPFTTLFLATYVGNELAGVALERWRRGAPARPASTRLLRLAAALVVIASFLAVLAPYLVNSKRAFGHYFYNVNSTFYVWADDWVAASVATYRHGDHEHWPDMPAAELPSASRYWREHSLQAIASRLADGFADIVVRSYRTFWFAKYVVVFAAITAWLAIARRRDLAAMVRRHAGLTVFLALYAVSHLLLIAFYNATSGTGTTRFLLAHVLPAAFVAMRFWALPPFSETAAHVAGARVTTAHAHLLVSILLALDVAFVTWPRLMSTYGGF